MEKDESQNVIESSFPPSRRNSLDGNKENEKSCGEFDDEFSDDISRMPDNPPKYLGHRRALSEIITLPDDISFDIVDHNGPLYSDETEEDLLSMMYLDVDKFNSSCGGSRVDDSSFPALQTAAMQPLENDGDWSRVKHEHSVSMDGCSIKPGMLISGQEEISSKKSISDAKLAELALVDPKHAKKILANRQSAARSKDRKMRYIAELERKIQILQTEASSCSAQLAHLQRDTNGLTAENNELKLRLQTMKQQIHMQDGTSFDSKKFPFSLIRFPTLFFRSFNELNDIGSLSLSHI
ncbi:hypothetical protein OSB04_013315 [Centaurea solstitialis]|uniref:BZIP domain-containing protein n=1 Tax=Centaurea solstitialis TaxID=347529 RepID=A0AA38TNN5_9ASTR|nr:hypothetical protein OSB04_013315 [Centaurea solstitialis]